MGKHAKAVALAERVRQRDLEIAVLSQYLKLITGSSEEPSSSIWALNLRGGSDASSLEAQIQHLLSRLSQQAASVAVAASDEGSEGDNRTGTDALASGASAAETAVPVEEPAQNAMPTEADSGRKVNPSPSSYCSAQLNVTAPSPCSPAGAPAQPLRHAHYHHHHRQGLSYEAFLQRLVLPGCNDLQAEMRRFFAFMLGDAHTHAQDGKGGRTPSSSSSYAMAEGPKPGSDNSGGDARTPVTTPSLPTTPSVNLPVHRRPVPPGVDKDSAGWREVIRGSLRLRVRRFLLHMERVMAQHALWRHQPHEQMLAAAEWLERYVMLRLYDLVFPYEHDKEKDGQLAQRIKALQSLTPQHLGVRSSSAALLDGSGFEARIGGRGGSGGGSSSGGGGGGGGGGGMVLQLAQEELSRMNNYKAPADKVACILRCYHLLISLLSHAPARSRASEKGASESKGGTNEGATSGDSKTEEVGTSRSPNDATGMHHAPLQLNAATGAEATAVEDVQRQEDEAVAAEASPSSASALASSSSSPSSSSDAPSPRLSVPLPSSSPIPSSTPPPAPPPAPQQQAAVSSPATITRKQQRACAADDFLPVFIYVVLKANVPHLHSNIEYIQAYHSPAALLSLPGYCLVSLRSATEFLMNIDPALLSTDSTELGTRLGAAEEHPTVLTGGGVAAVPGEVNPGG